MRVATKATIDRLDELAADVGRLRRRFRSNPDAWTGDYILDRIADHIESLDCQLTPPAAQIAGWHAPGDEAAIVEAIRIVGSRQRHLRHMLGRTHD